MSLISTASPWINDEPVKKRLPTMRKTVKKMPIDDDQDRSDYQEKDTQDLTDNESKVHNLLEKMTLIATGSHLPIFNPCFFPLMKHCKINHNNLKLKPLILRLIISLNQLTPLVI
jgi:hypothetical protein